MYSKTTRFESLLEAVPDALVGMDQKGVIRFVNRQTESLFGYDRDDMVGQPIETLVPEYLWQIYAEHREDYFADPRTRSSGLDLVLSGRQRDGAEFPVNISLSHIDTGDVLLVVTAVRDVATQRQAVEVAELTAAIVRYSNDAIVGGTPAGIITSWNPAAERLYGYSSGQIIGKYAGLLIPDDRLREFYALRAGVKHGEVVERLQTMRVRKDGTVFPVSITVAPIRDEDGAIVGASSVHRDVTGHEEAFEATQRLAAIVEHCGDAIIDGTPEGIIMSWNPAAVRLYGYSSKEVVGRSMELLSPEDRLGEISAILAKSKDGHGVERLVTTGVRKDGTATRLTMTVLPIRDANGAIVGVSTIARDIGDRR
jgi:PAS domain S-box-containing protein